jgi:hypothetical protein
MKYFALALLGVATSALPLITVYTPVPTADETAGFVTKVLEANSGSKKGYEDCLATGGVKTGGCSNSDFSKFTAVNGLIVQETATWVAAQTLPTAAELANLKLYAMATLTEEEAKLITDYEAATEAVTDDASVAALAKYGLAVQSEGVKWAAGELDLSKAPAAGEGSEDGAYTFAAAGALVAASVYMF